MRENLNPNIDNNSRIQQETEPIWIDEEAEQQHQKHLKKIQESKKEQGAKATQLTEQLDTEPQIQQPQDKADKKKSEKDEWKAEKEEKKYVEYMVTNSNIEWILKYIWFNDKWILDQTLPLKTIDFLNYNTKKEIEELKPIKDISENSIFQVNSNETWIIKETKKEYNRIHEKLTSIKEWKDTTFNKKLLHSINKLFKELKLLKKNSFISKLYRKRKSEKLINDIIHVKNEIKEQDMKGKLKKVEKHIRRIKQYERWEYINFPNWINFELMRWPTEEWNVKIWENEYYIRSHVETDNGNNKVKYIEYVDTLKKAREFLKKNNINIRYCRRCTRLANRKFIEAYEEKRKIIKWKNYTKTNRLKVLEQTENAVIFERIENDGKPPIRFIEEGSDLYDFATGEGKELFHESIMWLDLDKL